jgi:protein NDRG1
MTQATLDRQTNYNDVVHIPFTTAKCGVMNIYAQGKLEERQGKTIFMTVHDMGTNHKSMINFVNESVMEEVRAKSIFLHICVPGQEEHAQNWADMNPTRPYPQLSDIGNVLSDVLNHLNIKSCIGIGEGAGANIVCRFAMEHPNMVNGLVLVHCTSTTAGVKEYIKDKIINMKLSVGKMDSTAWSYLINHKFGPSSDESSAFVCEFKEVMQKRLNASNLSLYLTSFLKRTDLATVLAEALPNMDVLLVVGSKASYVHTVYTMHQSMNRERTTLLVVDGVGDVMSEAPAKLTRGLILFCKGCSLLGGVPMPGVEKSRTLSTSMEEADRPRKASITR